MRLPDHIQAIDHRVRTHIPPAPWTCFLNAEDDAYERRNREFHEALRQGFLTIAQAEPNRCVVLDAEPEQPHIAEEVWRCVQERLLQE